MNFQEKKRIIDTYIEKGYPEAVAEFAPASLAPEKVQELFDEGVLSAKINDIFNVGIKGDIRHFSDTFGKRAKEAGVKFVIDASLKKLLFTEEYLVITQMEISNINLRNNETVYEQIKPMPLVVPYSEISVVELKIRNSHGAWSGKTITKAGDPVKGAVIGGVIAGATGAVIGAAVSGKQKTETVIRAGSFNDDVFYVSLSGPNIPYITDCELFGLSHSGGHPSCHNWTWSMNAVLTGRYEIEGIHQIEDIQELYNYMFQRFLKKNDRFQIQEDFLKMLVSQYDCTLECSKFASQKDFYNALSRNLGIRTDNDIAGCLKRLEGLLQKKEADKMQLESQLSNLQAEAQKIKFWKSDEKKKKDKEICDIKCQIKRLEEDFYEDTTFQFGELLKEKKLPDSNAAIYEFTENETAIMELLRDGKKRTISEMIADSDKLANATNMRVAAASKKLMERGFLERSEYDKKAYFSLAKGEN